MNTTFNIGSIYTSDSAFETPAESAPAEDKYAVFKTLDNYEFKNDNNESITSLEQLVWNGDDLKLVAGMTVINKAGTGEVVGCLGPVNAKAVACAISKLVVRKNNECMGLGLHMNCSLNDAMKRTQTGDLGWVGHTYQGTIADIASLAPERQAGRADYRKLYRLGGEWQGGETLSNHWPKLNWGEMSDSEKKAENDKRLIYWTRSAIDLFFLGCSAHVNFVIEKKIDDEGELITTRDDNYISMPYVHKVLFSNVLSQPDNAARVAAIADTYSASNEGKKFQNNVKVAVATSPYVTKKKNEPYDISSLEGRVLLNVRDEPVDLDDLVKGGVYLLARQVGGVGPYKTNGRANVRVNSSLVAQVSTCIRDNWRIELAPEYVSSY